MNKTDKAQLAVNKDTNRAAAKAGYSAGRKGEPFKNPYPRSINGSGMANEAFYHDAWWRGVRKYIASLPADKRAAEKTRIGVS
jgi:hypothetical protein